ncbi:hypothetical protein ACPCAE_33235 [Streptomyces cinereoruber]|uniref:hypothetical protein n=1 Tax=Streptomyces cinereoruber TaxID=67260 RepID=UPI003C2DB3C2
MTTVSGMSSEAAQRLRNLAEFWGPRMAAAATDADLVKVVFDRAKAAAKRAQRNGDPTAMHELAKALDAWASAMEEREAKRQSRNGA